MGALDEDEASDAACSGIAGARDVIGGTAGGGFARTLGVVRTLGTVEETAGGAFAWRFGTIGDTAGGGFAWTLGTVGARAVVEGIAGGGGFACAWAAWAFVS